MRMMIIVVQVTALLLVAAVDNAYAQEPLPVIKADYVRTISFNGTLLRTVEEGTHYFASDGRYRVDRVRGSERISEIVLPASDERIIMNHDTRIAVRSPIDSRWSVSSRPQPIWRRLSESSNVTGVDPNSVERLGERVFGPLRLSGFRQRVEIGNGQPPTVSESWFVIDQHHEVVVEDIVIGTYGDEDAIRLVSAGREVVGGGLMDVPPGYTVRNIEDERADLARQIEGLR